MHHRGTEDTEKKINPITQEAIGAAIEVHKALGPGLLESAYETCLGHELTLRGLPFERQKALPVRYKGVQLDCGYRLDFVLEGRVILELKAVERFLPIHEAQLLTYLRLSGISTACCSISTPLCSGRAFAGWPIEGLLGGLGASVVRVLLMRLAFLFGLMAMGASEEPEAWVFFSPDSPDSSGIFRDLKALGVKTRAVLLTARYFGSREPAEPFLATLQAAGEVRVVDEEGLREAERLGIRELPAVAVRRGKRTHVASGTGVDVKELLRCSK